MAFLISLGVLLTVITVDAGQSMHNPFFCYTTDTIRSMTNMHGFVTSYEAVRRFNFTTVNPYVSTCTPSRFWYIGRYGGRYPSENLLDLMIPFAESSVQADIVRNYEAGRTTLCREDFEAIRNWTIGANFSEPFASSLTESGVIAMENIARRFQQHFPDILTQTYNVDRFLFRHINNELTNSSARAFTRSLFGEAGSQNVVYEDIPDVDWLLRPNHFCPLYDEETSQWNMSRLAWEDGPEIREMVEQVNRKLGLHSPNQLSFEKILRMWQWCVYETSISFERSGSETGGDAPWCAPFSVGHHHLMEYWIDLGAYYLTGYGVRNERLVQNLSCGLLQDLLSLLTSQNDNDRPVRVYITLAQTIRLMLVALGTFRDVWHLHQHNFAQQTGRHWIISLMSPLASNLAVVRYDCDDGDHDVLFYLNERPILVPGCDQQTGVCKVSFLVQRYQRFIDANCSTFFCSNQ